MQHFPVGIPVFATLLSLLLQPALAGDVSAAGGFTAAPVAPAYAPVDGANPLVQVGGWTETVPLELPPGRGGAPPISLTADFHIPDGPLGPGWRLDGFSRIDRQSKTGGVPRLGPSDVFLLDGVRLYDDGAGFYRLERDDGRLVTHDGGPNTWTIQKDGWTWTYGETFSGLLSGVSTCAVEWQTESLRECEDFPGSGAMHSDQTTAWLLASVEDPHGNTTTYQYMVPDGTGPDADLDGDHAYIHLPESVTYGPTTVEFDWEARNDRRSDSRSGRMRTTAARLGAIYAWANGDTDFASAYAIRYLDDDVAGCPGESWPYPQPDIASVVHRVERLGTDGGSKTLRCVETDANGTAFGEWTAGPAWESTLAATRFTMMMVSDGDQYPDLLAVSGAPRPGELPPAGNCTWPNPCVTGPAEGGHAVVLGWTNDEGTLVENEPLQLWLSEVLDPATFAPDGAWNITDLDRDGASDLLWANDQLSAVEVSSLGSGMFAALAITGTELADSKIGDIDGDGFPDLLDGQTWIRNSGSAPWLDSTTAASAYWDWDDVIDFAAEDAACGAGNLLFDQPEHDAQWTLTQLVDVNGDGLADLVFSGTPCWHEQAVASSGTELVMDGGLVQAVLLGDGQGMFTPAGYTAGGSSIAAWDGAFDLDTEAYVMETTQWTTADVDHSGRVEVIDGLNIYPDRGLPAGFGFEDASAENVGGVSVLGMASSDSAGHNSPADQFLFADWDADGFTDVLHVVPPAQIWDATSPAMGAIELARSDRTVSRHRITKIHGPWGGDTTLTYGFTDPALNPHLQAPMEVISSVTASDGTTRYAFEGGTWWAAQNRFIGFEDALLVGESGASTHYRFAISPWFNGDYVFKAEQRPDGTLAHFTWRSAQAPQGFLSSIDNVVPYFNPTRRVCDVEIGEGYSSGGMMHQTVSEVSLAEQCEEADGHPNFGGATWEALYGWKTDFANAMDRDVSNTVWGLLLQNGTPTGEPCDPLTPCGNDPNNPGGNNNPPCDPNDPNNLCPPPPCPPDDPTNPCPVNNPPPCDPNAPNNPCVTNPGTISGGTGGAYSFNASPDGAFGDWHLTPARYGIVVTGLNQPGNYAAVQGAVPAEIVIPTTPVAPTTDGGMLLTRTRIYVTDWSYDPDHRVDVRKDLRDLAQPADDLKTIYDWAGWDAGHAGKQLDGWEVRDSSGSLVGSVGRLGFSDWDTPATLQDRVGTGREWHYTYDHGQLVTQSDPDGVSESWTRNSMGEVLTHTDASGRVETYTYDFAGRQWLWEWEGASTNVTMDEFGRAWLKLSCTDSGTSACMTETWLRDDDFDRPDDRGWWTEPRAIMERGDGSMRLLFLDPWGRESLTVDCQEGAATSSDPSSLLYDVGCVPGTEIQHFQAWAEDGTPRMTSRAFAPGDLDVAGTWTYSDSLGRPSETLSPAPDAGAGRFVSSFTSYGVGEITTEGPTGYSCTNSSSTLYTSTDCAGDFQGSQTLDPLGRVTRTEDAIHTVWRTEYDAWGRATRQYLDGVVALWDGSTRSPETRWTYTDGDRVLTEQDADGNWTETHYRATPNDGRIDSLEFHPAFGLPETVKTWSYADHSGANTRSVAEIDVDGNVQTSWLDGFDRVWKHVNPDWTFTTASWNSRGQLARSQDVLGVVTAPAYDAAGRTHATTRTDLAAFATTRSCLLESSGAASECTDETSANRSITYAWNGAVLEHRLGTHVLSSTVYEDDGQVASTTGSSTTSFFYDAHRRPAVVCEGDNGTDCGVETTYTYDAVGRVTAETWCTPTDPAATRTHTRNPLGWVDHSVEPDGATTGYGYDVLGRVRRVVDPDGATTQADFDGYSRPTRTQQPGQGWTEHIYPTHHEIEVHAPDGGVWTSQTDWAGRQIVAETADGIRTETIYAGPLVDEVDVYDTAAVHQTRERFGYDARGQLAWRWGPYDAMDTDTVPVEGLDTAWFYAYDDAGRNTQIRGANDETNFAYDPDGLINSEEAVGVTTHSFTYDAGYPRLVSEEISDGSAPFRARDLTYDPRGLYLQAESWTEPGHVLDRTFGDWDASGTPRMLESSYDGVPEWEQWLQTDARGRIVQAATQTGGVTVSVDYQYTPGSRVQRVQTDAGAWTYGYTAGVLQHVQMDAGPMVAQIFNRDPMGRAIDIGLAYGGHIQRGYDTSGRIESESVQTGAMDVTNTEYGYDGLGQPNWTERGGTLGLRRDEYAYSAEGFLVQEDQDVLSSAPESILYGYDPAGNRTSRARAKGTWSDASAYSYDYGNRLISVTKDADPARAVGWNGYGEVEENWDGTTFARYPDGSELAIVRPDLTLLADITRDAFGRPAVVDDGGVFATVQMWGNPGSDLPLAGFDANNQTFANVAAEGALLGEVHGGTLNIAATDAKGNLALTGGGELIGMAGAFGDAAELPLSSTNRYVWGGQALLPTSTLMLAQHRTYDADLGRWMSADPIGLAGGDNRFVFAGNRPLEFVDPSGLAGTDVVSRGLTRTAVFSADSWGRLLGGAKVFSNMAVVYDDADRAQRAQAASAGSDPGMTTEEARAEVAAERKAARKARRAYKRALKDSAGSFADHSRVADAYVPALGPDHQGVTTRGRPNLATGLGGSAVETGASATDWEPEQWAAADTSGVDTAARNLGEAQRALASAQGALTAVTDGVAVAAEHVRSLGSAAQSGWKAGAGAYASQATRGIIDGLESNPFQGPGSLASPGMWLAGQGMHDIGSGLNAWNTASGFTNGLDEWSETQMQQGLAQNELAANAGGVVGTVAGATTEFLVGVASGALAERGVGIAEAKLAGYAKQALPCGMCFPAGTPVLTMSGLVGIETITLGTYVWSKSDTTGEEGWQQVTAVLWNPDAATVAIPFAGLEHTEVIEATLNHPFWVRGRGWVSAGELSGGDYVYSSLGGWLRVDGTPRSVGEQDTYNLTVDEWHTFFVGGVGAWGHNACGKTVKEAASELARRAGRNRVSARSAGGTQLDVDLDGKGHFDKPSQMLIETPHVHESHINSGPGGASLSGKVTRPATMDDIRLARSILDRQP